MFSFSGSNASLEVFTFLCPSKSRQFNFQRINLPKIEFKSDHFAGVQPSCHIVFTLEATALSCNVYPVVIDGFSQIKRGKK